MLKKGRKEKSIFSSPVEAPVQKNTGGYIVIDYPQENEEIASPYYAIRIGTSGNGQAEVSIDGGDFQGCRCANGFWWFDWTYISAGSHRISARLIDEKGKAVKKSDTRKCTSK